MRENVSVLEFGTLIFFATLLRYILLAGTAFLVFYVIFKKKLLLSKIQQKFPKNKDYFREIAFSFITFLIFTLVGVGLYNPTVRPYTNTYFQISDYGYLYLFLFLCFNDNNARYLFLLGTSVYASSKSFPLFSSCPSSIY